jgi:hypothetical protein
MPTISHLPMRDDNYRAKGYAHNFKTTDFDNLMDLAELMVSDVWSPIVWKKGRRLKESFASSDLWSFDFDSGRTIADVKGWLDKSKIAYIIGLSKSHQLTKISGKSVHPPCDRFRVVVPMHEPIRDLEIFEYNMTNAIKQIGCDPSCKDGARFYFPCKSIHSMAPGTSIRWRARPVDLPTAAELTGSAVEKAKIYAKAGCLPREFIALLEYGVAPGGRHKACYRLGANLILYGHSIDRIVSMIADSPLAEIGLDDVRRAVANGYARTRRELDQLRATGGSKA